MNKDELEEGMLVTQEGMLLNKIDIQMLLQLLVEKGIVTRDEVATKREYVSRQPMYKNSMEMVHTLQQKNKEGQYFSQEFTKYLQSDSKEGDIDYIKKVLGV